MPTAPNATAMRELEEELGIKLADEESPHEAAPTVADSGAFRSRLQRLFKLEAQPDTGWEFVWVYRLEHEGPFALHPDEIERGGWFAPEEVDRWLKERPEEIAPALRLIWPKVGGLRRKAQISRWFSLTCRGIRNAGGKRRA